ncbi:hypothetical protein, conserved in T. vivax [Trypanosoma vivax Y486]|uniref:Uncharacterized protein n=1 Tax=Trypanosoma vivax (strain Y486) TaxID=1055687 RepID=F9WSR9_TRYVY|nr:hypothetical protein, conserved in T. vivax [Trypanosoma vivax Y486]|eukprot:CCD20608.1 hypothetical protein, conserved in T. vivax [Trypanosoma vivax Y486]
MPTHRHSQGSQAASHRARSARRHKAAGHRRHLGAKQRGTEKRHSPCVTNAQAPAHSDRRSHSRKKVAPREGGGQALNTRGKRGKPNLQTKKTESAAGKDTCIAKRRCLANTHNTHERHKPKKKDTTTQKHSFVPFTGARNTRDKHRQDSTQWDAGRGTRRHRDHNNEKGTQQNQTHQDKVQRRTEDQLGTTRQSTRKASEAMRAAAHARDQRAAKKSGAHSGSKGAAKGRHTKRAHRKPTHNRQHANSATNATKTQGDDRHSTSEATHHTNITVNEARTKEKRGEIRTHQEKVSKRERAKGMQKTSSTAHTGNTLTRNRHHLPGEKKVTQTRRTQGDRGKKITRTHRPAGREAAHRQTP